MAILRDSVLSAYAIAALATAGVITRPLRLPEAIWAVAGAVAMVALGVLPWADALAGVGKGLDVYLFLGGMMLIAEVARQEGVFDWLAALAVAHARGSPRRLFALVYAVGVVVTVFLSNDATAVVLTPAVYAAARAAGAAPLPYLLVCAFVANAASFVLPISNPANLVIFAGRMPPLAAWLALFGLPSLIAIGSTYAALGFVQRRLLAAQRIAANVGRQRLGRGGRLTVGGIGLVGLALLASSALDLRLGLPTFVCGLATTAAVLGLTRRSPWPVFRGVSWGVLPLVAGLFVIVEALERTGLIGMLRGALDAAVAQSGMGATWGAAAVVALASNLMNNLPVGLVAGSVVGAAGLPAPVLGAILVGVDLGPNLSITGSLATLLWLAALRREGVNIGSLRFLRAGLIVMTPALVLAVAALVLSSTPP